MSHALRKLRLLTWKYYYYRKYYWIWTLMELFLPVFLIYLVIRAGEQEGLIDHSSTQQPFTTEQLISIRDLADSVTYDIIYYTPKNPFTDLHMKAVMSNIVNERTGKNINTTLRYMQNERLLVLELSKYTGHGVGIVYLTTTDILEYKIRDRHLWNTSSLLVESESDRNGPIRADPYYSSGFVGLQYFMESIFIYLKEDKDRMDSVLAIELAAFQPFPYPEYPQATSPFRYLSPIIMAFSIVITSFIILGPLVLMMMKLAGLEEKYIWIGWYIHTLFHGVIIYTFISYLLRYDFRGPDYAVMRYVQPSLLWAVIMLFFTAQIAFCFIFCTIFDSTFLGLISFCVMTISMGYGAVKVKDYDNMVLVYLSCLTPVGAFIEGFERMTYYEILELNVTWRQVFAYELASKDAPLGFVLGMLIFDTGLYLFLTYFINSIHPKAYGYRKSANFFFKRKAISIGPDQPGKKKGEKKRKEDKDEHEEETSQFIESAPVGADVNIVVNNLNKNFGPVHAVKGINFTMYKNEIFVVVGHRKAGKTTTLAMISGLVEPTSGQILYRGSIDLLRNLKEFRKILGFCPQENRLLPYFTIIDHLLFYGMLKGGSEQEAEDEGSQYLHLMGIYENAEDLVSVISTELKRKLSISLALMGNAEVLVLDEPTSGLDPISKRRIWNLLKEIKHGRTIIVSSSLMKEADTIGDRIAIMNDGVIVCQGSTEFLHNTFATGYDVKIKKKRTDLLASGMRDPTEQIVEQMKKAVPGTKLITRTQSEIIINLPSDTTKFPALFKALEGKKGPLNIDHIAVSCTTLETVYAKIGGDSIYDAAGRPLKLSEYIEDVLETITYETEKLAGIPLLFEQHKALFMKKYIFVIRTWFQFAYRVLIPTILMTVLIWGTVKFDVTDPPLVLSLASYGNPLVMTLYNKETNNFFFAPFLHYLSENSAKDIRGRKDNIPDSLLEYSRQNIIAYRRELLLGADLSIRHTRSYFDATTLNYTMFYNKFGIHSFPIAINTIHNSYYTFNRQNDSLKIITINHPIKGVNVTREQDRYNTDISESSSIITVWYVLVAFFTIDLLNFISMAAVAERIDGFKHIQFLSSVSPFTYWINTFIFDFSFFSLIMLGRVIIFKTFDEYGFFAFQYDFAIVLGLIILFMISGLLFMYLLSFILNTRYGGYAVFLIFNFFCTIVTFTFYTFQTYFLRIESIWSAKDFALSAVKYCIFLTPPLNFSLALEKYLIAWRVNHIVEAYARQGLDGPTQTNPGLQHTSYLEYASESNPNGILEEVLFLVVDIVVYSVLIISIECGYVDKFINSIFRRLRTAFRQEAGKIYIPISDDVQAEHAKVQELTKKPSDESNIVLIAKELRKVYRPFLALLAKQRIAVANASFLVQSGECFVIVGPKEAGKTTTLKMLAGDVSPTKGDSWILNTKLGTNKAEYFSKAGYCAQYDSFLKELTGTETLYLIASFRGVFQNERNDTIEKLVTILGLKSVINKKCSTYNEGNRRKICVALALIGDPNVVFLDAPASRIDPLSRRSFYTLLGQVKSTGQAVVVSSRSMQECETICDRFTIMIKGEMKFIGSVEELKAKFADVFRLLMVVKDVKPGQTDDSRIDDILQLKAAIEGKFTPEKCLLISETTNSVLYEIKENMGWGELFQRLEDLKKSLKFIKEYQLSDKSLEEMLASFMPNEKKEKKEI